MTFGFSATAAEVKTARKASSIIVRFLMVDFMSLGFDKKIEEPGRV